MNMRGVNVDSYSMQKKFILNLKVACGYWSVITIKKKSLQLLLSAIQ